MSVSQIGLRGRTYYFTGKKKERGGRRGGGELRDEREEDEGTRQPAREGLEPTRSLSLLEESPVKRTWKSEFRADVEVLNNWGRSPGTEQGSTSVRRSSREKSQLVFGGEELKNQKRRT